MCLAHGLGGAAILHAVQILTADAHSSDRRFLTGFPTGPLTAADAELLGGSVEIGNRGGINVKGHELNVPLEAE